ncbi:MAG: hypothetical protein ACK56I_24305, partial [bacterium]
RRLHLGLHQHTRQLPLPPITLHHIVRPAQSQSHSLSRSHRHLTRAARRQPRRDRQPRRRHISLHERKRRRHTQPPRRLLFLPLIRCLALHPLPSQPPAPARLPIRHHQRAHPIRARPQRRVLRRFRLRQHHHPPHQREPLLADHPLDRVLPHFNRSLIRPAAHRPPHRFASSK